MKWEKDGNDYKLELWVNVKIQLRFEAGYHEWTEEPQPEYDNYTVLLNNHVIGWINKNCNTIYEIKNRALEMIIEDLEKCKVKIAAQLNKVNSFIDKSNGDD